MKYVLQCTKWPFFSWLVNKCQNVNLQIYTTENQCLFNVFKCISPGLRRFILQQQTLEISANLPMSQHSPFFDAFEMTSWRIRQCRTGWTELDHLDHLDPDISPSPITPNTTGGASPGFTRIHQDLWEKKGVTGSTWEHHFRHQRFFHAMNFSHWKNISYDCEEVSIITIRYPYIKTLPLWFSGKLWGPRCHKWWLGLRKSSPKMKLTYLTFLIQEGIFKTFLQDFPFFS